MASSLQLLLLFLLQSLFISSSTEKSIVFPLKTQHISSGSIPTPPNKVFFHHNISLTVSLSIGTPPQNVTVVLDTGSELSWLRCTKTPNVANSFNPVQSSSYSPVPCSSPICKTQTRDFPIPPSCDSNQLCHVSLSYADASSTEGNLALDTLYFGNSPVSGTVLGCMNKSSGSTAEEDSKNTGLLGMNRGTLSFISQVGIPKFSYCISNRDSSGVLVFGESNFSWLQPLNYTPLIQISLPLPYFDRLAYSVQLEGIRVSEKLLPLPKSIFVPDHTGAGQTMVDSGTQFTFLLGPAYAALKNEFLNQTKGILRDLNEPNFVFQGALDLCFRIPANKPVPALPAVSLIFRGAEITVTGERLLYRVTGEEREGDWVHCFTFGNSDLVPLEAYVIGHHHQHDMWVEYDLEKSRVGFAPSRCDLAGQRLGTVD